MFKERIWPNYILIKLRFNASGKSWSSSKCEKIDSEQAGAELCQAQVKLEVIVYIVEEGWS